MNAGAKAPLFHKACNPKMPEIVDGLRFVKGASDQNCRYAENMMALLNG